MKGQTGEGRGRGSKWHFVTSGTHSVLDFLPLKYQLKKLQFVLMLLPAPTLALLPQDVILYFKRLTISDIYKHFLDHLSEITFSLIQG